MALSNFNVPQASRRTLLKRAAAAAVAVPLAAPRIHASDKSGKKNVVVGDGEHRYECIHDWGRDNLPDDAFYGNASHGVAVDSAGFIYITHYGAPGSLFVFDPDEKYVKSMAAVHQIAGKDARKTGRGHGIDIRREGSDEFLYLSPSETELDFVKMSLDGEIVWRKNRQAIHEDSGRYDGEAKFRPTNISFSPDGGYFLGDGYGSSLIHQYGPDDQYLRTIGGWGSQPGQFQTPHGHWLDDRDGTAKLVVADRANERLQWFDMEGNHLQTVGGFLFPADIDAQGDLLLVPDLHCRITLLDKDNQVAAQLGDDRQWRAAALDGFKMRGQREQWKPGKFIHPHDACFDADGNIFVTEWVDTGRVTKLRKLA